MKGTELVKANQHNIRSRREIQEAIEPAYAYLSWVAGGAAGVGGTIAGIVTYVTDFQFINGANSYADSLLLNGLAVGIIAGGLLALLFTIMIEVGLSFLAWRHQQYLDRHHWRPRIDCRHPSGRTDTEPRWEVIRTVTGDVIHIRLIRWEYNGDRWIQYTPYPQALKALTRQFSLEEIDEADTYTTEIIKIGEKSYAAADVKFHAKAHEIAESERDSQAREALAQQWYHQQPTLAIVPMDCVDNSHTQLPSPQDR